MSEYLDELDLTIATLWTEGRISCPHPDLLASYLDGTPEPEQTEYLRFHLEEVACPHCRAVLEQLGSEQPLAPAPELEDEAEIRERLLRSTQTFLRASSGKPPRA